MRPTDHDLAALQQTLAELKECPDVDAFHRATIQLLPRLISTEYLSWCKFEALDPANRTAVGLTPYESKPLYGPVLSECVRLIFEHPFTHFFAATHDPTALIQSDFWTQEQFRASSLYDLIGEKLKIRFMLSLPIFSCDCAVAALTFSSWGKDYTERDQQLLNMLRPGFDAAHRDAQLRTADRALQGCPLATYGLTPREAEVARWLAAGKQNPEMAMILDTNVRTIEKHMERVLQKLGAENRTTAAVALARSPDLTQHLTPRVKATGNRLRLTPRETEIARWLSIGKTNQSIARKLRISNHTVEKHVEAIIAKLGVENRTTAAVMLATARAD